MSDREFTGKTIDDAIEQGLKTLNITREQAEITVIEEPVSGFLRSKKAKVKVELRKSDGIRAVEFLDELLDKMSFPATGELVEEEDKIKINLITTNSANLIGYRGEVLDAFQILAGAVANTGRDYYKRVVVDCENYREKRQETLINLASKLADKAIKKGRRLSLEPMNPYERRIIHSALSENKQIKTISEGREPNRFIVIIPENAPNQRKPRRPYDKKSEGARGRSNFNERRSNRDNFRDKRESTDLNREPAQKPAKKISFGTYLGNSLKD